jgi:transposase-like protein
VINMLVGRDPGMTIENVSDDDAEAKAELAARRLAAMFNPEVIDQLLADANESGTPIDGVDGLLNQMTKAVFERALQVEMTHHLGYERDDPAGHGSGNSRNGSSTKTVSTTNGPVTINVPRDRNGEFEPQIVPKRARRVGQIDQLILSLYARGMSTRDIEAHLREVYGVAASRELISNVTDVVADEVETWRNRPVDEVYPIVYIDGIRIRVRDKGAVTVKTAHLAVGVDVEGRKHALGLWIAEAEGAKFWHSVLTQLRNRGLRDILIACCDGLTGLPEAITAVFPDTIVQTCVVHVIRNAMRFVSYSDRKKVAAGMRTIYTAPSVEAAEIALKELDQQWGQQYPGVIDVWRRAWNEFIPFLDYPVELRRIVYTTNMIESINYQLRKITKTRGHFPSDEAALKLLYLGLRNISSKRGGESGTGTHGWKTALNTLVVLFPGRLPL